MENLSIFFINLPKDTERKNFMETQLSRLDLSYERVVGCYGDDPEALKNYDEVLAIKEHGKPLTRGELGCAFSHRLIYKKMINDGIEIALIMEDDVLLPKKFKEILLKQISENQIYWDWLSFDYPHIGFRFIWAWLIASWKMTRKNKVFFVYALVKFPFIVVLSIYEWLRNIFAVLIPAYSGPKIFYRPLYNAGAYLITLEGVKKLMPLLEPIRFSADRTPNQARVKTNFKMRWYVPKVISQEETFESNTIN